GLVESVQERRDIVSVHRQRIPPEATPPGAVGLYVVLQKGGIALAETVDIDDRAEVIELKMHGELGRFPVGALDGFAIAHQDIGGGKAACRMTASGRSGGRKTEDPQTSRFILETGDDLRGGRQGDSP